MVGAALRSVSWFYFLFIFVCTMSRSCCKIFIWSSTIANLFIRLSGINFKCWHTPCSREIRNFHVGNTKGNQIYFISRGKESSSLSTSRWTSPHVERPPQLANTFDNIKWIHLSSSVLSKTYKIIYIYVF